MIEKRKDHWTIRFIDKYTNKYVRITSPRSINFSNDNYFPLSISKNKMKKIEIIVIDKYYNYYENIITEDYKYKQSLEKYYLLFITNLSLSSSKQTVYEYTKILNKYFFPLLNTTDDCKQIDVDIIKEIKENILSYNHKVRTINSIFTCINKFLSFLVVEDVLSTNKLYQFKNILQHLKHNEISEFKNYLTINEILSFLKVIKKEEKEFNYYLLFEVLFFGALRIGELLALTFNDVDFINSSLKISKSLNQKKEISKCKNIYSCKTISLPKRIIEEIKIHKEKTNSNDNDNIFFKDKFPTRVTLKNKLKKYLNKININRNITLHGFRHSMASYMFSLGISILDISKHLRHKNPSVTLSVYTHQINNDYKEIIERLDLNKKI